MLRSIITAILRVALRIFFSRLEVEGGDGLPADRAVIFALNHPNALIDPLVLLCLSPRRISFLGKEPLLRMPVIGFFMRAFEVLPVYRAVDQADPRKNADTFARARAILGKGGAIAIFPEGTTHSDAKMRPLKTGAARIALGAASSASGTPIAIVPAGLYYTNKGTFRSKVLLVFGEPIDVPVVDGSDEPPRASVTALSEQIRDGLMAVTVNVDNHEALAWITRAQRVFTEPSDSDGAGALTREFTLRRRFVDGYDAQARSHPDALQALADRINRYERDALDAGVAPDRIPLETSRPESPATLAATLALLALPAAAGAIVNGPLYHLVGYVSNRLVAPRDSTVVSTVKLLASLLLYPLLWFGLALVGEHYGGARAALLIAALCPVCARCAVAFEERWHRLRDATAPLGLLRRDPARFARLCRERGAIRDEIVGMGSAATVAEDPAATAENVPPRP